MFSFQEISVQNILPLFTIIRWTHTFEMMKQEQIIILYL